MPATPKTTTLHGLLLDGFTYKSRADGSVHTVSAGGRTVAEVCVGKARTRINFREEQDAKARQHLGGKSHSWAGGMVVTEQNLEVARGILDRAVQRMQKAVGAAEVSADLKARQTDAAAAKSRLTKATRTPAAA